MAVSTSLLGLIADVAEVCGHTAGSLAELTTASQARETTFSPSVTECLITQAVLHRLHGFLNSSPQNISSSQLESLQICFETIVQAVNAVILDVDSDLKHVQRYSEDEDPRISIMSLQGSLSESKTHLRKNRSSIALILDCIQSDILEGAKIQVSHNSVIPNSEKFVNMAKLQPEVSITLRAQASTPHIQQFMAKFRAKSSRTFRLESKGTKKLHEAISMGDYTGVCKCLSDKADPNAPLKGSKTTPMHRALSYAESALSSEDEVAARDIISIISALILSGANLENTNDNRETPLIRAVKGEMGNSIISLMLESGAPVNATDKEFNTALHYAAMQRASAEVRNVDSIRTLLAYGANHNIRNQRGRTPLYKAVMWKHQGRATELLDYGADLEVADNNGWTPLYGAVLQGNASLTKLLCDRGAYVDKKDKTGQTPLHYAVSQGLQPVIEVLVGAGADVNLISKGETPLCRATAKSNGPLIKYLLSHGADVSAPSPGYNGALPIHIAAMGKDIQTLEILVEAGSPLDVVDGGGRTPRTWASEVGKQDAVKYLDSKGASS